MNGWEKETQEFATFLKSINDPQKVKEVVLLGDLMDDWVYPVDVEPPSLQAILKAPINKAIMREFKNLAKNEEISVLYLPGNHDMGVNQALLTKNFPGPPGSPDPSGIRLGGTAQHNSVYRTSRLRAEHGSAYAMFNAPDTINNPGTRLPLGYFIGRVVATKTRDTGSMDRWIDITGPMPMICWRS
jgi:hypothetical protein